MRVYVCASASVHVWVCVSRYQVHASVSLCVNVCACYLKLALPVRGLFSLL